VIGHNGGVSKILFHSDSTSNIVLTSGLKDGVLNVFDMRSHQPVFKERIHGGAINFLDVTPNGEVISGSADKKLKIF